MKKWCSTLRICRFVPTHTTIKYLINTYSYLTMDNLIIIVIFNALELEILDQISGLVSYEGVPFIDISFIILFTIFQFDDRTCWNDIDLQVGIFTKFSVNIKHY